MSYTVEATAGLRSQLRAQVAALRLQGRTLAVLVERKMISPDEAAAHVRDAATFLDSAGGDPEIESIFSEVLEGLATDLEAFRHQDTP